MHKNSELAWNRNRALGSISMANANMGNILSNIPMTRKERRLVIKAKETLNELQTIWNKRFVKTYYLSAKELRKIKPSGKGQKS